MADRYVIGVGVDPLDMEIMKDEGGPFTSKLDALECLIARAQAARGTVNRTIARAKRQRCAELRKGSTNG